MNSACRSLAEVRKLEKELRQHAIRFVLGNLHSTVIRRTAHFREWFHLPMNYARIMELPLTLLLLDAAKDDTILDVASPKLLALYFARIGCGRVVASDLEDYFVSDFEAYRQKAGLAVDTAVFDAAREIPYPDAHSDKIFSVSVLEHIAQDGDMLAMREMLRVLKPGGSIVITVPASTHYVEEWTTTTNYWRSVRNEEDRTFYQRRYDSDAVMRNFSIPGGAIEEVILIAERPIEPPRIGDSGMMLHNSYYIDSVRSSRWLKAISRRLRIVPFIQYLAERIASRKCHYLTADWADPNIRQAVIKITRTTGSISPEGSDGVRRASS